MNQEKMQSLLEQIKNNGIGNGGSIGLDNVYIQDFAGQYSQYLDKVNQDLSNQANKFK